MGTLETVKKEVPPLLPGDKLTRDEFLRRWEMHPEIKLAELIGGIVYMPSPVTFEHGDRDNDVGTWICVYRIATPGTDSGQDATTLLLKDIPQADVNLRILPECGGASRIQGNYLAGPVELFTEVSRSSASYDLNQKYDLYESAGVQEYLAILLHEEEIRWHVLVEGHYEIMPPDADGIWRSRVFPGLWLDGAALLRRDMPQVLAKLQEGIGSPEHEAFVEELARS